MDTADGEPLGETNLEWLARGIAVGVFPMLWLLNWWREASSHDPYYDMGKQGFLAVTALVIAIFGSPFLPALTVVLTRRMTSPRRLLAASIFAAGAGGTILSMWAYPRWFASESGWLGLLLAGAAVTWAAVRAVARRDGVD